MQGRCNFFAQCALVESQREKDMKNIIDHYKQLLVLPSFMNSGGKLNDGDEGKSKLLDISTKHISQFKIPASECPGADIVAIDTIQMVQKMSNPASEKTFKDLTDVFCRDVEELMGSCRVVVIVFDTNCDISLMNST